MIIFGTLLWIDEENHSAVNNKNKSVISYFRQAKVLNVSLHDVFDAPLHIFTNDVKRLSDWFAKKGGPQPEFVELQSDMSVPKGTPFYTAHYKIDAVEKAASLLKSDEDRFILLDTDIIALRPFDEEQLKIIEMSDLLVYDISDQVFLNSGSSRIKKSIDIVLNKNLIEPHWFGGEFLCGKRDALLELVSLVKGVLPSYFSHLDHLHHKGDEMFVSACLNDLIERRGLQVRIQNPYFIIARHWSRHTDHSLSYFMKHSFVHCPGSKPVLEFLSYRKRFDKSQVHVLLWVYQKMVVTYQRLKRIIRRH